MERVIDTVMLHSTRIDERARLIARLADLVGPYVTAAVGGPGANRDTVLRRAVLSAARGPATTPFALIADALWTAAEATGHPALGPAAAGRAAAGLAVGLVDGCGLTADQIATVFGVVPAHVEAAHAQGRDALGLPPPPIGCAARDRDRPEHRRACADCLLTAVDRRAAVDRIGGAVPHGPMVELLTSRARHRRSAPAVATADDGPQPFVALVGMAS